MVDQVGVLPQGGDGGVFGVAGAALSTENQHTMALVLADPAPDRLQRLAESAGGFALTFSGVDLNRPLGIEPLRFIPGSGRRWART